MMVETTLHVLATVDYDSNLYINKKAHVVENIIHYNPDNDKDRTLVKEGKM